MCLMSSKTLNPHPLSNQRVNSLPSLARGGHTRRAVRGVEGQYFLEDVRHISVFYVTLLDFNSIYILKVQNGV
jgi:hypothetical protein